MINRSNMDLVWSIIGSKRGFEKPTVEELSKLGKDNLDLIIRLEAAFENGGEKEYQSILDDYWKLEFERRIEKFVESEGKTKRPQSVVIGDTYYTRHGEPLKREDKVTWHSMFGEYSGILKDFKMIYSTASYKVKVICFIKTEEHEELIDLNDGDVFNIDGEKGNEYFDKYLECPCREYLT